MENSRDAILRSIRAAQRLPTPLPEAPDIGIRYPDARQQFAKSVIEVGGRCVFVGDRRRLNEELEAVPEYASARKIVSLVPGVRRANVDLPAVSDAHHLNDVDFCVVAGELGVAENGAVWVQEGSSPHRAVWFLAQHTALVLAASVIVDNMHQAYARLPIGGPGFAVFISGPSKTADIEQALVIGAQGPRSCTVLVVDN